MRGFPVLSVLLSLSMMSRAQTVPVPVEQEPHHHVVLKNDSVLVLRVNLAPGESTLYHTHSHDRASLDLADNVITREKLGEAEGPRETSAPGDVSASTLDGPYTHRVKNVGANAMDLIDVEFLQRSTQPVGTPAASVSAENRSARIYRWTLAPGAASPMHTHNRPYLIVSATSLKLTMAAPDGRSLSEEVKAGDFHWVDAKVTHSLSNQGSSPGVIVEFELK